MDQLKITEIVGAAFGDGDFVINVDVDAFAPDLLLAVVAQGVFHIVEEEGQVF
jgi:hypothetical protein